MEGAAVAAARTANHDEAVRAVEIARAALTANDLERAIRLLRRAYILEPLPEAAALLQQAQARARADTARYCSDCFRLRQNCSCGGAARPVAGQHPVASAITAVGDFVVRAAETLGTMYQRKLRVLPSYSNALAWISLAIVALAILRVLAGRPLLTLFDPLPAATPGSGRRRFREDDEEAAYAGAHPHYQYAHPGAGSGWTVTTYSGGGFGSSFWPSILLTVGVNVALWLARTQQRRQQQQQ